MNKNDHINQLVDDAINSADNIKRAEPKPYLLTRIRARLDHPKETLWEKTGWFVGRPVFAIPILAILIVTNFMVIAFNRPAPVATVTEQLAQGSDEFSLSVSSIYDIENTEP
ncbi:MAG: hypothetical protein JWP81_268 [Ferruginibacter sp.]|nr:hypothetical protein [Ferruginibacter sp.]